MRANLALDVGGNHLVKNLKALVGPGVFLADDALVDLGTRHLARQLPVQVLVTVATTSALPPTTARCWVTWSTWPGS